MSPKLSPEQQQALAAHAGQPIEVEDPDTRAKYVLVRLEIYEQLQKTAGYDDSGDVDPRAVSLLVDHVLAEDDAADPALKHYQHVTRDTQQS
jgi:hypothetical protein